jgi:uncharacterized Fe-S center protein
MEMASKVYFMDGRSYSPQTSMVAKTLTVFEAAGFESLIRKGDIVAIKVHCGEWNNTAYLRPVYARALADRIKSLGGRPFVCETTTVPYGPYSSRSLVLDLLETAERNGYTSAALGCPFICADGFMGTDDLLVELPEGYLLKEAYVARGIAVADVLITLTHFKGHSVGVVGGAIKNLGIGAQSKRGKLNVHMSGHPRYGLIASNKFHPENCKGREGQIGWQVLEDVCPYGLIHVTAKSIEWDKEKCCECRACAAFFAAQNLFEPSEESFIAVNAAIADACLATVKTIGRNKVGFINLALDLTPRCDCLSFSDTPILPNLGVFAGYDPVALDKACLDMAKNTPGIPGSSADEMDALDAGTNKFEICAPLLSGLNEDIQVNTGEINGLGIRDYELVTVKDQPGAKFNFPPDPRPIGVRMRERLATIPIFPKERHGGKGYLREPEVDLEYVNVYYDKTEKLERMKK